MNREFYDETVIKSEDYFRLIKSTDTLKKGKQFNCFGGLVSGIVTVIDSNEVTLKFSNKEYFKYFEKKKKVTETKCRII